MANRLRGWFGGKVGQGGGGRGLANWMEVGLKDKFGREENERLSRLVRRMVRR